MCYEISKHKNAKATDNKIDYFTSILFYLFLTQFNIHL